ncbi:hypothetical protein [Rhizobium etli]|nr:hypothetical protein [Rhizobium etli]
MYAFLLTHSITFVGLILVPQCWYYGLPALYFMISMFLMQKKRSVNKALDAISGVSIENNIVFMKAKNNRKVSDLGATTKRAAIRGIHRNFWLKGLLFGAPLFVTIAISHVLRGYNSGEFSGVFTGIYIGLSFTIILFGCGGMMLRALHSLPNMDSRIEKEDHEYFLRITR